MMTRYNRGAVGVVVVVPLLMFQNFLVWNGPWPCDSLTFPSRHAWVTCRFQHQQQQQQQRRRRRQQEQEQHQPQQEQPQQRRRLQEGGRVLFSQHRASSVEDEDVAVVVAAGGDDDDDYDDDDDDDEETVDEDDESWRDNLEELCMERNFPLEKVKNSRDLASIRHSPIRPNRIYRMGKLSDATERDCRLLFGPTEPGREEGEDEEGQDEDVDVGVEKRGMNIRTIIDLRSPTELKEDETLHRPDVFSDFVNVLWIERGLGRDGCLRVLSDGETPVRKKRERFRRPWKRSTAAAATTTTTTTKRSASGEELDPQEEEDRAMLEEVLEVVRAPASDEEPCGPDISCDDVGSVSESDFLLLSSDLDGSTTTSSSTARKERHFVSLMNEFKYVRGTLSKVRKRDIASLVLKGPGALVSRKVRTNVKRPFLNKINDGGLPMLNELLLRYGAPGIRYVLELCADPKRHPVAFHCTAGKDRTGAVTAIMLALVGVPDEYIVEDYSLSANVYAEMNDHKAMVGALSQRSLNPKTFLGAPPHVMTDILGNIRDEYGSIEGYLDWIGFGPEKQEQLKRALLE